MEKVVEVYGSSNFGTTVIIRMRIKDSDNLVEVVRKCMYRVESMNKGEELFKVEAVHTVGNMEYKVWINTGG